MTVINVEENLKSAAKLFVGLSLEQRHLFQCLLESNNRLVQANEQINAELQQMRLMVQTQLEIPPQVALQRPVTLLDACGSISAFHLDFINCTEAFLAVLKIRFHQQGVNDDGIQMLENSQFVLQDYKGNIDLSQPWQRVFRPNQKVDMSMKFRHSFPARTCPACSHKEKSQTELTEWQVPLYFIFFKRLPRLSCIMRLCSFNLNNGFVNVCLFRICSSHLLRACILPHFAVCCINMLCKERVFPRIKN